jgi:arsenate reductase
MFAPVENYLAALPSPSLSADRHAVITKISAYIQRNLKNEKVQIVAACSHNSRRSIFAEAWLTVLARAYGITNLKIYSAGGTATSIPIQTIRTLQAAGLKAKERNGKWLLSFSDGEAISAYSKDLNDPVLPSANFFALMVCGAPGEEACPYIPFADERESLWFPDPKKYDGLPGENEQYQSTCRQIAAELKLIFESLKPV